MKKSSSYKSSYRPEIDGLRAFAVLSVVVFHAFPSWLKGGFIGVDVFFVISGFLITGRIFENLEKGNFSFADFFGRRVRRIFPTLILVMTCSFAFGWFTLLADEFAQLGKHIASGAAFITNFILVDESGYFDNAAETKPMLHLWSLAVEEQFYIVWPFVLWLAWKLKFNLLTITISVAVLSFYLNLRFVESHPIETFFWPTGRFWELLSGSVLAWTLLQKADALSQIKLYVDKFLVRVMHSKEVKADGSTTSNIMSFFGLLLLAYGVIRINESLPFPSKWALIPVLGTVLVIASGSKAWLNRVFLMNPLSIWFGLISYPLYLWHWSIFSFLNIVDGQFPHRDARILAVIISIVLAWLTFQFVEKPIRFGAKKALVSAYLCFFVISLGGFGMFVYQNKGFEPNIVGVHGHDPFFSEIDQKFYKCENASIYETSNLWSKYRRCWQSKENTEPNIILLGDSHAEAIFFGIAEKLEHKNVAFYIEGGRPSLADKEFDTIFSELKKSSGFGKTILILTYYRQDFARYDLVNELKETVLALKGFGYNVILLGDVPYFQSPPSACLGKDVFLRKKVKKDCNISIKDLNLQLDIYDPQLRALSQETDVEYLPTNNRLLCGFTRCSMVKDDVLLYRDKHHLNAYGSRLIGGDFASRLLEMNLLH